MNKHLFINELYYFFPIKVAFMPGPAFLPFLFYQFYGAVHNSSKAWFL